VKKNPHAVALEGSVGFKGGVARTTKLSKAKRTAIAREVVQAR